MKRHRGEGPELCLRLNSAEKEGRCLSAVDSNDSRRLSRLCRKGVLVRPVDGFFARASFWDSIDPAEKHRHVARSLSERHGDWVFSHVTAAALYGLSVGYSFLDKIHAVASSGSRRQGPVVRHRSVRSHRVLGDVRVTTPEDAVLDCAAIMPFPDALAVADSAVASRLTCEKHLRNAAVHRSGYRGIRAGRWVVACVDGRAESGGESIVRGILIELGFSVVDVQTPVPALEKGGPLRLDILLRADDGSLVDLEVDGEEKYTNVDMNGGSPLHALMRERQREAGITARGYKVMRTTVAQARNRDWLVRRLATYGVHPNQTYS